MPDELAAMKDSVVAQAREIFQAAYHVPLPDDLADWLRVVVDEAYFRGRAVALEEAVARGGWHKGEPE